VDQKNLWANKEKLVLNIIIHPYIGLIIEDKKVNLQMSRDEIVSLLGKPLQVFNRLEGILDDEKEIVEVYNFMHVLYDKNGYCEAFEIFDPGLPIFKNNVFLGKKHKESEEIFQSLGDTSLVVDESGLTSYQYGIGLYTSSVEENLEIESMIVFKKDYYDKTDNLTAKLMEKYTSNKLL
jgi:hypothetical protein